MSKQVSFSSAVCTLTMALFAVTMSLGDYIPAAATSDSGQSLYGPSTLAK